MNSRRFPSFSSSLLDEIYKSFDERRFEDDHKVARRSTAEIESRHEREREISRSCHVNYSSYSSCSLNEDDTMYGVLLKPKHIRTCVGHHGEFIEPRDSVSDVSEQKPNHVDGKFVKTKSKALKIYSDLKKMKKPISPKLSMFFNSIFSTTKNRETEARLDRKSKSANASTYLNSEKRGDGHVNEVQTVKKLWAKQYTDKW
nr:protein BIG GRAIN 1-like A [Tanacetum cinerariifolium]